jgi:hypothetical protein
LWKIGNFSRIVAKYHEYSKEVEISIYEDVLNRDMLSMPVGQFVMYGLPIIIRFCIYWLASKWLLWFIITEMTFIVYINQICYSLVHLLSIDKTNDVCMFVILRNGFPCWNWHWYKHRVSANDLFSLSLFKDSLTSPDLSVY